MMRLSGGRSKEERTSALWGKSGKSLVALAAIVLGLVVPSAALAAGGGGSTATTYRAFIPKSLNDATIKSPRSLFNVIVKGTKTAKTADVAADTSTEMTTDPASGASVKKQWSVINGVYASLSGKQVQVLVTKTRIASITPNGRVGGTA